MSVSAWRIVKARHAGSAFTGEGAKQAGGRWNSPGVAVVYAAQTASLAMLEMLVHLHAREILNRYVLFELTFDESLVTAIDRNSLPRTWRRSPPPLAVQQIGDAWVASAASAVLTVPSAIVPREWIYVLNVGHPDFKRIAIGGRQPVKFDSRLVE